MPLSRKDQTILESRINAAIRDVHQGYLTWEATGGTCASQMIGRSVEEVMRTAARKFPHDRLAALDQARHVLGSQLARFEDRDYNLNVCFHTIETLAHYEEMATNLVEDIASLKGDRQEELLKTPTGKWAVKRRLHIGGRDYQEATVCTNPAVGTAHLDKWEHELRSSALVACDQAQITV